MMRRLSLVVLSTLAFGAIAGMPRAHAAEVACATELRDLDAKRTVLTDLQAAVAKGEADRQALSDRAEALATDIAEASAAGKPTGPLVAQRKAVLDELDGLRKLAPAVAAQVAALAAEVDADEQAYLACVDASL